MMPSLLSGRYTEVKVVWCSLNNQVPQTLLHKTGLHRKTLLRVPIKSRCSPLLLMFKNTLNTTNMTARSHLRESWHTDVVFKENEWKAFSREALFTLGLRYLSTPQLQGLFVIWKDGHAMEDLGLWEFKFQSASESECCGSRVNGLDAWEHWSGCGMA